MMEDLGTKLRRADAPMAELVKVYGLDTVLEELGDMACHDMADWAFEGALALGPAGASTARYAALVLSNSGSYGEAVKQRAKAYLSL